MENDEIYNYALMLICNVYKFCLLDDHWFEVERVSLTKIK